MVSVIDDSYSYLNSSIRTYVNATSTLDKLFAVKLIVLSMIVAADALIEKLGELSDTPFQSYIEESSLFLPMAAYEQRITDISLLEDRDRIPRGFEFSRRLRIALDTLKIIHGQYSLRSLLAINIKKIINDSQFFILDIHSLLEKK
ncbi:MAG: hypothetical protein ACFFFH_10185 [Candidatus Thorarchaeota archaeon]